MLLSSQVDILLNINVKSLRVCYLEGSEMNITSFFQYTIYTMTFLLDPDTQRIISVCIKETTI